MTGQAEALRAVHLDRYNKDNFSRTHREKSYEAEILRPFVADIMQVGQTGRVLDLASGRGEVARYFRRAHLDVVQLDLSASTLTRSKGMRVRSFANQTPFADASFDAIHIKDAIIHIDDLQGLFDEMARLLVPGGHVLVTSNSWMSNSTYANYRDTNDRPVMSVRIKFKDSDDYIEKVKLTSEHPQVMNIEPPYFETNPAKTVDAAEASGFKFGKKTFWTSRRRLDWYGKNDTRVVLQFEKR